MCHTLLFYPIALSPLVFKPYRQLDYRGTGKAVGNPLKRETEIVAQKYDAVDGIHRQHSVHQLFK